MAFGQRNGEQDMGTAVVARKLVDSTHPRLTFHGLQMAAQSTDLTISLQIN